MYLSTAVINTNLALLAKHQTDPKWSSFFSTVDDIFQLDNDVATQMPTVFPATEDSLRSKMAILDDMKDSIMKLTTGSAEYEAVEAIVYTISQDYLHLLK